MTRGRGLAGRPRPPRPPHPPGMTWKLKVYQGEKRDPSRGIARYISGKGKVYPGGSETYKYIYIYRQTIYIYKEIWTRGRGLAGRPRPPHPSRSPDKNNCGYKTVKYKTVKYKTVKDKTVKYKKVTCKTVKAT